MGKFFKLLNYTFTNKNEYKSPENNLSTRPMVLRRISAT